MPVITTNLAKYKEMRIRQLAEERWNYEVAGIIVPYGDSVIDVKTDRESRANFTDIAIQAAADLSFTLDWKTPTGWIKLTSPEIAVIMKAIREHVQRAYQKEARCMEAIRQATTLDEVKAITFE